MHENHNKKWTFFTNHSHTLFSIYSNPDLPMRAIAARVGITERAVNSIIKDLLEIGAISIQKTGRANRYIVNGDVPLRHQIESPRNILDLLNFIGPSEG